MQWDRLLKKKLKDGLLDALRFCNETTKAGKSPVSIRAVSYSERHLNNGRELQLCVVVSVHLGQYHITQLCSSKSEVMILST